MAERRITVLTVVDFGREFVSAIEVTVTSGDERYDSVLVDKMANYVFPVDYKEGEPRTFQYRYRVYMSERAAGDQRSSFESPAMTT